MRITSLLTGVLVAVLLSASSAMAGLSIETSGLSEGII